VSLQDLDALLKKYWEGMFRKSAGPLQPVEMARALVREMGDKRRVSVSRVYAPNAFTVCLGSADFEQTAPLQSALARELEGHLLEQAEERGFSLIGKPEVSFKEDQALDAGGIRIESSFNAAVSATAEEAARAGHGEEAGAGHTTEFQRIDQTMIFGKGDADGREHGLYLAVVQGPDMGKIFSLGREHEQQRLTIGRKMTNNIYLTDINASREHAQVEWRDGALFLKDLKSRNSTFVNGDRIEEQQIGAGDLIQIGENIFQIEGG
jgi:hypothetical protein